MVNKRGVPFGPTWLTRTLGPDGLQRNAVVNISNKMKYGKEIHVVMRYVNKMHPVRN